MKIRFIYTILFLPIFALAQPMNDPFASTTNTSEATATSKSSNSYPDFNHFANAEEDFSIRSITIEELYLKMEADELFFLLDARPEDQFEVSRLPNAKRVGFNDFGVEKVWMVKREAPVIIYCNDGSNSKKVGKYLELMGFSDVRHLSGTIEWLNNGYSLVDDKGDETKTVHVGDKENMKLLKKGRGVHY